ncbi:MAG: hypothetical protein IJV56_01420 [Neisseriaceae bacterium]|nr:hypothetical protein [Neisseriaceae bacterium]
MSYRFSRTLVAVLLSLAFSGSLSAKETTKESVFKPDEKERYEQISNRADAVYKMILSEMLLQKNATAESLALYAFILNKESRPEIAERGMQIALEKGVVPISQAFYQKWQSFEPNPSFAQKRMAWEQLVAMRNTEQAIHDFAQLLKEAPTDQHPQLFLKTAQLALLDVQGAKQQSDNIHDICMQYPNMSEAAVADTLYAAIADNKPNAVAALKRLANQNEPKNPVIITLELLSRYSPNILDEFFNKHYHKNLSNYWQNLYIESLIRQKKYEPAQKIVLQQLETNPNAILYMQAGYISLLKKEDIKQALTFFDKAYAIGNKKEQSRTALFAAMGSFRNEDNQNVKKWINKIHDGDYDYYKLTLHAIMANSDKQWNQLNEYLQKIIALPTQQGVFFNSESVVRLKIRHISNAQSPEKAITELTEKIEQLEKQIIPNKELIALMYHARGTIYADKLRQFDKAVADLEKYWQIDPDDANAQNALGYTMLFVPERINEGVALLEKAIKQLPDSAAVQDSLGWGYYRQGNAKKGLPYLQSAYEKMPEAEIAAHLGEVLWTLGKQNEAREIWQQGYQKDKDDPSLKEILQKFNIVF